MLVGDWTAASPPWHRMHVNRTTLVPLLCLAVGLTVTASATTSAAEERPHVRVVWTDTPPEIDGHLDDEVWKTAALVDRLTQVVPVEGSFFDVNCYVSIDASDLTEPVDLIVSIQ